jgi:hypothetical protein
VNSTGAELRVPISHGIAGHVASTGEFVVIPDAYSDCRFNKSVDIKTGSRTRNMLCAPLRGKTSGVIGVVQLINKTGVGSLVTDSFTLASADRLSCCDEDASLLSFTPDDILLFQLFACQAASAVETSSLCAGTLLQGAAKCVAVHEHFRDASEHIKASDSKAAACEESVQKETCDDETCKVSCSFWVSHLLKRKLDVLPRDDSTSAAKFAVSVPQPCARTVATPRAMVDPSLQRILTDAVTGWNFDALALAQATGNKPLSTLSLHLFETHGLLGHFQIDHAKLLRFVATIENGYDDANQYHNRAHAASVLHAMHALLRHGSLPRLAEAALGGDATAKDSELVTLACLLSAIVHDYEHKGLSNDFLVKSGDERAIRYNDRHANESHHVAAAFAVLHEPECNFLSNLPGADYKRLRSLVIELVVGTDMADNATILEALTSAVSAYEKGATATGDYHPATSKDAVVLLQVALKCADLGHLTLPWINHLCWVERLQDEFFTQGDKEQSLGLQVSFLMDRNKPGVMQSQTGFFEFVALPLFRLLQRAVPNAEPMLLGIMANYERWQRKSQKSSSAPCAGSSHASREQTVKLDDCDEKRNGAHLPNASCSSTVPVAARPQLIITEVECSPRKKKSGRSRQRAAKS